MNYISKVKRRIKTLIYYVFNVTSFKKLELKSMISPSNRIEGKKFISIGKGVTIRQLGWLLALKIDGNDPSLVIEDGVEIGDFSHIACVKNIVIEKDVIIAHGVYISDNVHTYDNVNVAIKHQKVIHKNDVVIGTGSWIGEHACIIGAKIGRNCVIGANVVLTKDVPDYTTVLPSQKIEWNYYTE